MSKDSSWARRFGKAAVIVALIVLAPPAINVALGSPDSAPGSVGVQPGLDASSITCSSSIEGVLEALENAASEEGASAPEWFEDEIGIPSEARGVRSDAAGFVVSYVVDSSSEQAFAELQQRMELRGWTSVPLGGVDGATFLKDGGRCTWALATCTQVGCATNVVYRCQCS